MTRDDETLLWILGGVGVLWIVLRSRGAAGYIASDYGVISDYVGSAAEDIIEQGKSLLTGTTRGERNNNPGNIRITTDKWQGLSPVQGDKSFFQFVDPVYGIRALAVILKNYYQRYGLNTVRSIISRWAPPKENDTASYIAAVSDYLGIAPDQPFNPIDPTTMQMLVSAIIRHENGRIAYTPDLIADAVGRALS